MQKYRDTNEMELKIDIRTMIKDVLRYSWLIVIMAISFSLIAYMIIDSSYKPKVYEQYDVYCNWKRIE